MPGIVGYVDFNFKSKSDKGKLLDDMLSAITYSDKHRTERYEKPPLWIGRSDLTIFNPEQQPVSDRDTATIVFFQGNIVNKEDFEHSASNGELVLQLYNEFGTNFVHKVKGQFTVAIWDTKTERLIIANDRFGRYPIYYTEIDTRKFVFGSEVKAILLHPEVNRAINDRAIIDFIRTMHLWGDETFFTDIQLLPYASILEFGRDYFDIRRYWEYMFVEDYGEQNVEEYRDKLHGLLKQAVTRAVADCKNIGVTLSGGLDTRIIAAYIPRDRGITAFSFGEPRSYDIRYAKKMNDILGFEHHIIPLTSDCITKYGERVIYALDGTLYLLVGQEMLFEELEREKEIELKVVGSCSSTLFGGFLDHKLVDGTYSEEELFEYLLDTHSIFKDEELKDLLAADYYEEVKDLLRKSFKESFVRAKELHHLPANVIDYINFTERGRRWLSISAPLLSRLNTETVNIYDYDLVDFMLTMPPELRLERRLCVAVLKYYYPELARITLQTTGCTLYGGEFRRAAVVGFRFGYIKLKKMVEVVTSGKRSINYPEQPGNYGHYLREQRGFVERILLDERTFSRGIFNPEQIKNIVRSHMSGRADNTSKIAVLISLELWFRMFVDPWKR